MWTVIGIIVAIGLVAWFIGAWRATSFWPR